jgi:hypothetical protein
MLSVVMLNVVMLSIVAPFLLLSRGGGGIWPTLERNAKFNSSYSPANIFAVRNAFYEFDFKFKLTI